MKACGSGTGRVVERVWILTCARQDKGLIFGGSRAMLLAISGSLVCVWVTVWLLLGPGRWTRGTEAKVYQSWFLCSHMIFESLEAVRLWSLLSLLNNWISGYAIRLSEAYLTQNKTEQLLGIRTHMLPLVCLIRKNMVGHIRNFISLAYA